MFEHCHNIVQSIVNPVACGSVTGTFELALNVHEKAAVDSLYDQVVAAGGTPIYAPRDEPWKMRSAMIADPEGNLIEIASDFWE